MHTMTRHPALSTRNAEILGLMMSNVHSGHCACCLRSAAVQPPDLAACVGRSCWRAAVSRQKYADWVREEVKPMEYTIKKGVFKHNWPGSSTAQNGTGNASGAGNQRASGGGHHGHGGGNSTNTTPAVNPGDVVIMTQTSPDRCIAAIARSSHSCLHNASFCENACSGHARRVAKELCTLV